jgi:hypothetical protein
MDKETKSLLVGWLSDGIRSYQNKKLFRPEDMVSLLTLPPGSSIEKVLPNGAIVVYDRKELAQHLWDHLQILEQSGAALDDLRKEVSGLNYYDVVGVQIEEAIMRYASECRAWIESGEQLRRSRIR